jgi:hypothetical protein
VLVDFWRDEKKRPRRDFTVQQVLQNINGKTAKHKGQKITGKIFRVDVESLQGKPRVYITQNDELHNELQKIFINTNKKKMKEYSENPRKIPYHPDRDLILGPKITE